MVIFAPKHSFLLLIFSQPRVFLYFATEERSERIALLWTVRAEYQALTVRAILSKFKATEVGSLIPIPDTERRQDVLKYHPT